MPLHSDNESVYRKFKNMIDEEEQEQTATEVTCRHFRLLQPRLGPPESEYRPKSNWILCVAFCYMLDDCFRYFKKIYKAIPVQAVRVSGC
jgi:hypothetical protein